MYKREQVRRRVFPLRLNNGSLWPGVRKQRGGIDWRQRCCVRSVLGWNSMSWRVSLIVLLHWLPLLMWFDDWLTRLQLRLLKDYCPTSFDLLIMGRKRHDCYFDDLLSNRLPCMVIALYGHSKSGKTLDEWINKHKKTKQNKQTKKTKKKQKLQKRKENKTK